MLLPAFQLYLITDRKQTASRPLVEVIREAAEGGVPALQFREKDLSLREQFELALSIRQVTKPYPMKLFINDRIDLCLAVEADGVHLPANGFPIRVARRLLGETKAIGVSCHSLNEVKVAEAQGADFALLGPVYDTPSKRDYGSPLGIDYFRNVRQETSMPLFAVGGIKEIYLNEVFQAGADGIAMISEIMGAKDVRGDCKRILAAVRRRKKSASPWGSKVL